jgi:tryptophan synthase alpha chain
VAQIKESTQLPVAVGFGVKTRAQAREIAAGADAVAVGSALVEAIRNNLGQKGESTGNTAPAVLNLVQGLSGALRSG